jgi:tetratricopeptide (TPR) repeat protein
MSNRRARGGRWTAGKLPALLLVLSACAAYFNAWPDALALDDASFAIGDRFSYLTAPDYLRFFTEDLWAASGLDSGLYRPLLLASIALDAALFDDWVPGYHLVNIFLHLVATLMVFGFCRRLAVASGISNETAAAAAFFAALVFAVHPVHAEAVNSVFNRSEMLVCIGVTGGLWWFRNEIVSSPGKAWTGLGLVYFMALLCKESGVTLPALAVLMIGLTGSGGWRDRLRQSLPVLWLLLPLALYLVMRANALDSHGIPSGSELPDGEATTGGGLVFDIDRLPMVVTMWFESLRLLVWPHPLKIFHSLPEADFWLAATVQVILGLLALIAWLRGRAGLLAGLLFFTIALLPASRIIGEHGVPPHVTERYLYLPSVGLSLFIALELPAAMNRLRRRWVYAAVLTVAAVFIALTWARNQDWVSAVALTEHDYARDPHSGRIEESLIEALLGEGAYDRAVEICQQRIADLEEKWFLSNSCGVAWFNTGRTDAAEQAFLRATSGKNAPSAHFNLAGMYLKAGRRAAAREQFEAGIAAERNDFVREYRIAEMLVQLHPTSRTELLEARTHLEKSLELQPQFFQARRKLRELNRLLGVD